MSKTLRDGMVLGGTACVGGNGKDRKDGKRRRTARIKEKWLINRNAFYEPFVMSWCGWQESNPRPLGS